MDKKIWNSFNKACNALSIDPDRVLNFLSHPKTLEDALRSVGFFGSSSSLNTEIRYKDGDRITGNEKVIRTEEYAGATIEFLSENAVKISVGGLVLLQNNKEACNAFSPNGYREEKVLNYWPKAKTLPEEYIYLVKRDKYTSCKDLEKIYQTVGKRIELNLQAALNIKYQNLHKKFPNGIQRKDSKGNFSGAFFHTWCDDARVVVDHNARDWRDIWWFAGVSKF